MGSLRPTSAKSQRLRSLTAWAPEVSAKPVQNAALPPIPAGYVPPSDSGLPRVGRPARVLEAQEIPRREGAFGVIADFDQTIAPAHDAAPIPRPFPGIAALIHALQGAQVGRDQTSGYTHYVTARTPEYIEPLPGYLLQHGLPTPGNLHVGAQTERDEDKLAKKISDIAQIIAKDPGRGFVLFGDSSHIDPQVFQALKSRFPNQVVAAIIHRVKDNVPPGGYQGLLVVDDYVDAAFTLHELGVLSQDSARSVIECAELEGQRLHPTQRERLAAL